MKIAANDPRWKSAASDVPEKLKKALDAISYMPNAVASWMDAHGGDDKLARANSEKVKQAEGLLSEVLASLPAAVEYMVVGIGGGTLKWQSRDTMIHELKEFGIKHVGESSRSGPLRPELKGQPKFDKLVGPMYGGPGVVRYETGETYDRMSR